MNSIGMGLKEIAAEPGFTGTKMLTSDPAIRLMIHQLAFICGLGEATLPDYTDAVNQCEARAGEA